MSPGVALSARGLRKVYPPDILALRKLDLDIRQGEFVSIIGPSGCGKTTFLRIVAGLEDYQEGEVWFEGERMASQRPSWRRSVIYQDIRLFPWLTVRGNLEFALRNKGLKPREIRETVNQWLESFQLEEHAHQYPGELASGLRQKVAVCRVLATGPDIILCDEPFSALDWTNREFLQNILLQYWHRTRKTVVFVTHNIEEAVYLAQRVVCMTARPGAIKETLEVPLPEERWKVHRDDPKVLELARRVGGLIQEEVEKARRVELEVGY